MADSEVTSGATDWVWRRVVQACLIGAAFILAGLVLWQAISLVLLIFAGILLAILLDGVSAPLARRLPVPRAAVVVVIMLLILAALIGGLMLTGPELVAQGGQLRDSVMQASMPCATGRCRSTRWSRPSRKPRSSRRSSCRAPPGRWAGS